MCYGCPVLGVFLRLIFGERTRAHTGDVPTIAPGPDCVSAPLPGDCGLPSSGGLGGSNQLAEDRRIRLAEQRRNALARALTGLAGPETLNLPETLKRIDSSGPRRLASKD